MLWRVFKQMENLKVKSQIQICGVEKTDNQIFSVLMWSKEEAFEIRE